MLAEQRAERILRELAQRRAATVTDLCQVTGASEATIRRDLNALAKQGRLSKVHGGAMLMSAEFHGEELDMETKRGLCTREKARIAQYAAGLVGDDDVVFLDAGTSVLHMAERLPSSRALFLTNSIECACRLMAGTMALIGAETLEALGRYNFTKAFLGCNGVTITQGFTTPDPEEAAVKSLAADRAQEVYVLADSSKFGQVTAAGMFPIETACVITDQLPDPRYRDYTDVREV